MIIKKQRIPIFEIICLGILPNFMKILIYRLRGYKIGKNVKIGFGSVISGHQVNIGRNCKIGMFTIIRGRKINFGKYIQIGSFTIIDTENIEINDDARIKDRVIIGGLKTPESLIRLGKRTIVMEYSFINPTKPIIIGDDTGIGGHCLLFTHGSWLSELDGFPVTFAPITLGNNVWLPWRVFIMPGVKVGNNVVIGANSLISKRISSNVLAAGSPAKIIKSNYPTQLNKKERIEKFNRI
ncbi:DapH/DapD/GlmU-related protein, partial [Candidatus Neomarinimicrobiota bacterium]